VKKDNFYIVTRFSDSSLGDDYDESRIVLLVSQTSIVNMSSVDIFNMKHTKWVICLILQVHILTEPPANKPLIK